jgi:hypothetical protein
MVALSSLAFATAYEKVADFGDQIAAFRELSSYLAIEVGLAQ